MLRCNGSLVYLDFALVFDGKPRVLSFYNRALMGVKSVCSSLNLSSIGYEIAGEYFKTEGLEYDSFIQPIVAGKEKFYHALALAKAFKKDMLLTSRQKEAEDFYDYLMGNYDLPLLREWSEPLFEFAYDNGYLIGGRPEVIRGQYSGVTDTIMGVQISDVRIYSCQIREEDLKQMVRILFDMGKIYITEEPQEKLVFKDMDSYFQTYGPSLVENLRNQIKPLRDLEGNVEDFALKGMRLFPQQIAQINGQIELLEHSKYGILNHGMGTGKTVSAGSIIEGFYARKWLRSHPEMGLKDLYAEPDNLNYRIIVMCPGHLVEKWASEISSQIPYAKVTILKDFKQLVELRERGSKRVGREYYIVSKDFSKLSYQLRPSVRKRRYGYLMQKYCENCDTYVNVPGSCCPDCGEKLSRKKSLLKGTGMVCPQCSNIVLPQGLSKLDPYADSFTEPLDHMHFANHTNLNDRCFYCESELWEPHVANLGESEKRRVWDRATHYSNKAHKGKKSVWVHQEYASEYFAEIGEEPLNYRDGNVSRGVRKYAPSEFIKRYLRNFFDVAVFDEAHLCESSKLLDTINAGMC